MAPAVTADEARPARELLASITIADFAEARDAQPAAPSPRRIVVLSTATTIEDALAVLSDRDILSAPILCEHTGFYVGWFSLSTVLRWLIQGLFPKLLSPSLCTGDAMAAFVRDGGAGKLDVNCSDWARGGFLSEHCFRPGDPQGDGDLVWRGFEDTSLLDLVSRSLRADGATVRRGDFEPSHRVAVYREAQPGGKLEVVDSAWKKVVSQSDVIRTLAAHRPKLGPLFETRTLGDVFGPKPVVTVPSSLPTVAAFGVMYNADVSGLGVVDERGSLVAELALPDLRALKSSACFDLLLKPSLEFAQLRSGADSGGGDAATTAPLGATLGEAVSLLADAGVHRLYIVDTGKPVGVVTLTDILRLIAVSPDESGAKEFLSW